MTPEVRQRAEQLFREREGLRGRATLFDLSGPGIRGLSLTRPWPFAFVSGPERLRKRVENRSWKPPKDAVGQILALHAAQSWSEEDREFISDLLGVPVPRNSEHPHSQLFAVCRLTGYATTEEQLPPLQQMWFFGPYGWMLADFFELPEPVPCKGALGLWKLPPEVEAEVRRQLPQSIAASAAPAFST